MNLVLKDEIEKKNQLKKDTKRIESIRINSLSS